MTTVPSFLSEFPAHTDEQWRKLVDEVLAGASFEKKLVTKLPEGIDLQPLYTRENTREPGYPGAYPFLRGTTASGATEKQWQMCQEIPFGAPEKVNQLLLADLQKGLNAFRFVLDRGTRCGLWQSDQIGVGGTSVFTLSDLEKTFDGVDLTLIPLVVEGGVATLSLHTLLEELVEKRGMQGTNFSFLFDIFALSQEFGALPLSFDQYFDKTTEMLDRSPWRLLGIDTRVYADAGGSAVHELAFGMAAAIQYLREFSERGVSIDTIARHMTLHLSVGSRLFPEIAKLRAARMLWAHIVKNCGGDELSQRASLFAVSQRWNKTKHDVYVNMLRTTAETFAAILGGADGITSSPFDTTHGLPDDLSRRIARNTQLVLAEESRLPRVVDAGGGSWCLEALTHEMAEKAYALLQKVEELGGLTHAIQSGFVAEEIGKVARARAKEVSSRKEVIVGTNMYADVHERPYVALKEDILPLQERRMNELKNGSETLAYRTRAQFQGELQVPQLKARYASEEYEELRSRSEGYRARTGELPKVFLMTMGPLAQHKARADFARDFFEPGGYEVIAGHGFASAAEAVEGAISSKAQIAVLCSTDESYSSLVPEITAQLTEKKPILVVAGYPQEHVQRFQELGVDEFIHLRADNLEMLRLFHSRIGA